MDIEIEMDDIDINVAIGMNNIEIYRDRWIIYIEIEMICVWIDNNCQSRSTKWENISYCAYLFSYCFEKTWQKQPKEGRVYYGSRLEGAQSITVGQSCWQLATLHL